jgi:hypothetical protein
LAASGFVFLVKDKYIGISAKNGAAKLLNSFEQYTVKSSLELEEELPLIISIKGAILVEKL